MTDNDRDDRLPIMALAPIAPDENAVRQIVALAEDTEAKPASRSPEISSEEED